MSDECPCIPMTKFVAETEGRFNLIEEKFHAHADRAQDLAEGMGKAATQIEQGVKMILEMQHIVTTQNDRLKQGQERFITQAEDIETLEECMRKIPDHIREAFVDHSTVIHTPIRDWLKRLTYAGAAVVAFVVITHGDTAWTLVKLLL